MVSRTPMNSLAKQICLWHLVNSISIIKSLFKSTHTNTHIQKKPENITLLLSSIFSVVSFLCIFLYSSTAIPIISVIRKKRSMLYFKNTRFRYRTLHKVDTRMTRKFVKRSIIFFCLETNKQKKKHKLQRKLSGEQKKQHRKGLHAHLAFIIHSWVQANQRTSLDLGSCLRKVKMVQLVWWNLETAKQRTDIQEVFWKGPFSRG